MKQKPLKLEDRHYAYDQPDPLYVTVPPPKSINKIRAEHVLDDAHQRAFSRAVMTIISTPVAEETFAQIVDGLPLKNVFLETRSAQILKDDPIFNHAALCPGVLEKTRKFRDGFDPVGLELAATILQRYQHTPVGSKASKMPFLELVAVAIHSIAVQLFNADTGLHKDAVWPSDETYRKNNLGPRWPTPFSLFDYALWDQYPDGPADAAGYWAENRIFGGVVLFGRGDDGAGYDGVWFHSYRRGFTRRIYELREDQAANLLHFLEKGEKPTGDSSGPLPILGDRNNRRRVDPEIAMPEFNVYRDRWERTVNFRNWSHYGPPRNCRNAMEYPELEEQQRQMIERMRRNGDIE